MLKLIEVIKCEKDLAETTLNNDSLTPALCRVSFLARLQRDTLLSGAGHLALHSKIGFGKVMGTCPAHPQLK